MIKGTNKSLFSFIFELLKLQEGFRKETEEIQIAKGKYQLPLNFRDAVSKIKREWQ